MRLGELPIGARVLERRSDLIFTVADRRDGAYPGMTMLCEQVACVACMDAAEVEAPVQGPQDGWDRFGRGDYARSCLRHWLNSETVDWFVPSHSGDCPPVKGYLRYDEQPYLEQPGFLSRFSPAFCRALLETEVPVLRRTGAGQGELTHETCRMFLPSRTEIFKGDESGFAEGKPLPLCCDPRQVSPIRPAKREMERFGRSWNPPREDAPLDAPQIYDPRFGWWYWLRTPSLRYGFLNRVVSAYGAVSYTYANNDIVGVRPMCCLEPELEVELIQPLLPDRDGIHRRLYAFVVE